MGALLLCSTTLWLSLPSIPTAALHPADGLGIRAVPPRIEPWGNVVRGSHPFSWLPPALVWVLGGMAIVETGRLVLVGLLPAWMLLGACVSLLVVILTRRPLFRRVDQREWRGSTTSVPAVPSIEQSPPRRKSA